MAIGVRWPPQTSLRGNLFVMTLGPLAAALVVAGSFFLLADRASDRSAMSEVLATVGRIIASNSTAALVFGDTSAAEETLRAVATRRGVVLARLYDADGHLFAEYRRSPDAALPATVPRLSGSIAFSGGHLHLWQDVVLEEDQVGSLYLVSTVEEEREHRRRFTLLAFFVLAAASAAAILVSARLQQLVIRPVNSLVRTALAVSTGKDYSLRADRTTVAELGVLVEAFNHMMASIEERNAALQAARLQLERRVEQRTADLSLSAERLEIRHEMDLAIISAGSPEDVARAVLGRISRLVPCAEARLTVIDSSTGRLRVLAAEPASSTTPVLEALGMEFGDLEALRRGEILIRTPRGLKIDGDPTSSVDAAAFINVPMRVQGELVGVLSVGVEDGPQSLPRYGRILTDLAMSLAIAVRQASLFQQTLESEATKTRLLEEINHRVKNNLASIVGLIYAEMRWGEAKSDGYLEALQSLRSRVEGLGVVHSLLSASDWAPPQIEGLATQVLRTALQMTPPSTRIELDVGPSSVTVTPRQATSLAIVLNELATNAIKYAACERPAVHLNIDFRSGGGWNVVDLADDGPGYPEEVLAGEHRGLGLYLVEEMVRSDLCGELKLSTQGGARTTIRFPADDRASRRIGRANPERAVLA